MGKGGGGHGGLNILPQKSWHVYNWCVANPARRCSTPCAARRAKCARSSLWDSLLPASPRDNREKVRKDEEKHAAEQAAIERAERDAVQEGRVDKLKQRNAEVGHPATGHMPPARGCVHWPRWFVPPASADCKLSAPRGVVVVVRAAWQGHCGAGFTCQLL